jgi:hypothetical protein
MTASKDQCHLAPPDLDPSIALAQALARALSAGWPARSVDEPRDVRSPGVPEYSRPPKFADAC